jgi:hypothetical protein
LAGNVSCAFCVVAQFVAVALRQLHEVTAPPPEHDALIVTAPPLVPNEPLDGVRVIEHPLGGFAVDDPCQTTATDAEPVMPGALADAV